MGLPLRPAEWQLVLPLALAFVAFFAGPLLILAVVSAFDNEQITTVGFAMWTKFLGDPFYWKVIGDTVNTCARLESLTKDYSCPLVISRQAAEAAGLDMSNETLHEAVVKGRSAKVQFYALHRVPEPA